MSKKYTGSLSLEWYNKAKSILLREANNLASENDIPAPRINWVNKDEALFYEIIDEEGRGLQPFWVDRNDLRVKETRPLVLQKTYKAIPVSKEGTLAGMDTTWDIQETEQEDASIENMLIKGDNLLALNTLKKIFANKPEEEKVKCIYIDPPYNTGTAFELYDDNLAHSEWLTMVRDRLLILKDLMKEDGTIFISIDNNEAPYLQVLMDDIFGRSNRKNIITLKRGSVTGAKVINPGLVNISEFILVYAKNSDYWTPNRIYKAKERDERYNTYIMNYEEGFSKWRFVPLLEAFAELIGVEKKNLKKNLLGEYEKLLTDFVYNNSDKVIRFAALDDNSISKTARDLKKISKANSGTTYLLEREDGKKPYYIHRGELILFVRDRIMQIDGKLTFSEPYSDIWDDALPNDLHNEGGIEFRKSKKPEKLIQRLLELTTKEQDVVLDIFGGSGTTFAVSHKMKRKWIGVEIGKHADTHIIPRLKSVILGTDQSGISKTVNWRGGGSFKYYHLGESIIDAAKRDFRWALGKRYIEESLLATYDYTLETPEESSYLDETTPLVGLQRIGNKTMVGVVTLASPESKQLFLSTEYLKNLYQQLKDRYAPEYIFLFTNKGVELAMDSKPENLEIIKVPHAIFAELER